MISKNRPLFRKERLRRMLELIRKEQQVSTAELAERFGVTTATVRADLTQLEEQGLIERGHGGAFSASDGRGSDSSLNGDESIAFGERLETRLAAKQAIGRKAAELVADGATLMIDIGTTTRCVLLNLVGRQRLNIVTNAADLPSQIIESPGIECICAGGRLRRPSMGYVGEITEQAIRRFKASTAILGVDGISVDFGLTTPNEAEARVKQAMIESSKQLIVVADSSKLERVSLMPIAPIHDVSYLVTDDQAPPEIVDQFRRLNINVLLVPSGSTAESD